MWMSLKIYLMNKTEVLKISIPILFAFQNCKMPRQKCKICAKNRPQGLACFLKQKQFFFILKYFYCNSFICFPEMLQWQFFLQQLYHREFQFTLLRKMSTEPKASSQRGRKVVIFCIIKNSFWKLELGLIPFHLLPTPNQK